MPVLEDDEPVHAPHPPLETYDVGEEGRRPFVGRIFDRTAEDYDRIERLMTTLSAAGFAGVGRYVELGIVAEYAGTEP